MNAVFHDRSRKQTSSVSNRPSSSLYLDVVPKVELRPELPSLEARNLCAVVMLHRGRTLANTSVLLLCLLDLRIVEAELLILHLSAGMD